MNKAMSEARKRAWQDPAYRAKMDGRKHVPGGYSAPIAPPRMSAEDWRRKKVTRDPDNG